MDKEHAVHEALEAIWSARELELRKIESIREVSKVEISDELLQSLVDADLVLVEDRSLQLTPKGIVFFRDLGIEPATLEKRRRPLLRPCLDWTERRHHLAGSLASALFDVLLGQEWLLRKKATRVLEITPGGFEALERHFALARADIYPKT